jgi:hypothetical protein
MDFIHLKAFDLECYRNDLVGAKPAVYNDGEASGEYQQVHTSDWYS